jgi:4-azaleucine resistance transporter AzlC
VRAQLIPTQRNVRQEFFTGIRDGLPLTASIFAYGLVFGVLARQAGLSYAEALLMSAAVFAGASQFAAVAMLTTGMAAMPIIMATLLLNLRHLLMGASLAPYLKKTKAWKLAILAHGLNDESFALTSAYFSQHGGSTAYFLAAGIATFIGWFGSTIVSAATGNFLGDPVRFGLDFAFYGVFIGLLIPQIKDRAALAAALTASLAAVLAAKHLSGNWYIILATAAAVAVGMVAHHEK